MRRLASSTFCIRSADMEESLRELGRFTPQPRKGSSPEWPSMAVLINPGAGLNACLSHIANIVRRQPRLEVHVDIAPAAGALTRQEFRERSMEAAAIYGRIWNEIDLKGKSSGYIQCITDRVKFFTMSHTINQGGTSGHGIVDVWMNLERTSAIGGFDITFSARIGLQRRMRREFVVERQRFVVED